MIEQPLFSICIPTYNRAEYLINSIETIICQKEFLDGDVEIVISDNASTDSTEEVCRRYAKQYSNLYYYRNDSNISDENFPLVLSRANGALRRLCNDTLCFENGALHYICEIVQKYKDERPYVCWLEHGETQEISQYNFRAGVRRVSYWMTSIACFSIWDNECINIERDIAGAELRLWQVRKGLELATEKDRVVVINQKLTYTQIVQQKNISYGLYQVFYVNYFELLSKYFNNEKLNPADKEFLEKDLLFNFFLNWCANWKLQNSSLQYSETEDLCECIYQQYHSKAYWNEYLVRYYKLYLKLKAKDIINKVIKRG